MQTITIHRRYQQETVMVKTFFEPYDSDTQKTILSMLPTPDLLRLISRYYKTSLKDLEERQTILIEIFSRHKSQLDIDYQSKYLQHVDLELFQSTLSNHPFILVLKESMTSSYSNLGHKLAICDAWHGKKMDSEHFIPANHSERKISKNLKLIKMQTEESIKCLEQCPPNRRMLTLYSILLSSFTYEIDISELTHAFLPKITEDETHQLKRRLFSALSKAENTPKDTKHLLITMQFLLSKMDANDINIIINFALNKIKENDYEFVEQFASLLPTLWSSHKQLFVRHFFEAISNTDLSNRSKALNTIATLSPGFLTADEDIETFLNVIAEYFNSSSLELRSAAFLAAAHILRNKDKSIIQALIGPLLTHLNNNQQYTNALNVTALLLPKLEHLDRVRFIDSLSCFKIDPHDPLALHIIAENILPQLEQTERHTIVMYMLKSLLSHHNSMLQWNNVCADVLSHYIITHQISEAFEMALKASPSINNAVTKLQTLLTQWQSISDQETIKVTPDDMPRAPKS